MTRRHTWAAAAGAAAGLLAAGAAPVAADEQAAAAPVPWSVSLGTAAAAGERWIEPTGSPIFPDLVVGGTLTNTGTGCYSVWTRFFHDFAGDAPTKLAQVCGPGTAAVAGREYIDYTTSAYITVCRGTTNTSDCAAWKEIL